MVCRSKDTDGCPSLWEVSVATMRMNPALSDDDVGSVPAALPGICLDGTSHVLIARCLMAAAWRGAGPMGEPLSGQ